MQKYLVTQSKYFVDPHGDIDDGGKIKYISDNPIFGILDNERYYDNLSRDTYYKSLDVEEAKESLREDSYSKTELSGSEDGYNSVYYKYETIEIFEEHENEIEKIINEYNNL